ncbi:MAG TPA: hypothetical protein VNM37_27425, partial [Candidatus Dormibacteraeota bacterium]|nr:hypothetical protein [Candidatus Dormibacteraeota bacterium]
KATDTPPKSADPTAAVQNQFDEKLKALEAVLTPAQLDSYRQMQQAQLKMMEGFLGNTKKGPAPAPLAGPSATP